MILVRDVFVLKFGQARAALAAWREGEKVMRETMKQHSPRILTDLVGNYYTLVLETTFEDLSAFERTGKQVMNDEHWRAWYKTLIPLVEKGHREIFTIVE